MEKIPWLMGYGPEGAFDYGGVGLGAYLYEDYDIRVRLPTVKKKHGEKPLRMGSHPRQGDVLAPG